MAQPYARRLHVIVRLAAQARRGDGLTCTARTGVSRIGAALHVFTRVAGLQRSRFARRRSRIPNAKPSTPRVVVARRERLHTKRLRCLIAELRRRQIAQIIPPHVVGTGGARVVWQHEQKQAAQPHPIDWRHRPPEDRSAVGRPRKRGDAPLADRARLAGINRRASHQTWRRLHTRAGSCASTHKSSHASSGNAH